MTAIRQLDKAIAIPITTGAGLTALTNARSDQLSDLQALYNAQTLAVKTKIIENGQDALRPALPSPFPHLG
jgi:hypothetical protein